MVFRTNVSGWQDEVDLSSYCKFHRDATSYYTFKQEQWPPTCSHAARTVNFPFPNKKRILARRGLVLDKRPST
jgi:hypothetical protein